MSRRPGLKYHQSESRYQVSDIKETTNRRERMKAQPPIGELDKKGVREAAIDPEARALG